ncbi:MAG TPA: 50S ribosomal protein L3 N(5)-glutamine methyltransferase [Burkholderiales bacterium]|nr:50S ribosomal protein L3 N(5)-glutamine methyltransferase [Burkholderiales bacterium]
MTLREIERRLRRARLSYGHGTHEARGEATWLFTSVKSPGKRKALLDRRIRERIPLAYLLNEAWLDGRRFYVDRRVIVPRSFISELLRERLRPWLHRPVRRALDLCTGSGCLAVLTAQTFPQARVDASDISRDALEVAGINVRKHRLGRRIRLLRSDLFSSITKTYDLIVTNPPYVDARAMRRLPPEYDYEPRLALAAGADGLDLVRKILSKARQHLNPGGLLVCEVGDAHRALERAYPELPFAWPETSEPGTVFILERDQLPPAARRGGATRTPPRRARARR